MNHRRWRMWFLAIAVGLGGCAQADPLQANAAEKTRPAAVAGLFYPDDKQALEREIDGFLAAAKGEPIKNLRGLVVPHAGYRYSGPTAAFAYKQLAGRDFRTVLVMGPSHTADFQGAFISGAEQYETPLGRVQHSLRLEDGPFQVVCFGTGRVAR